MKKIITILATLITILSACTKTEIITTKKDETCITGTLQLSGYQSGSKYVYYYQGIEYIVTLNPNQMDTVEMQLGVNNIKVTDLQTNQTRIERAFIESCKLSKL